MTYLYLFGIKIIDNCIMTAKSLAQYKHKKILSSALVALSQLLFYVLIKQIVNDGSWLSIWIVVAASFIGNYIAFIINDKFKKDDVWENIITSSDKEMLINLCTMLKEHKIKYLLFNTYNRSFNESLTVMIFSKTKAESKLIDAYLEQTDAKYLRMIDGIEVKRIK